jgi:hypothetical protein
VKKSVEKFAAAPGMIHGEAKVADASTLPAAPS